MQILREGVMKENFRRLNTRRLAESGDFVKSKKNPEKVMVLIAISNRLN